MYLEIRKVGKKKKYYLSHSFRIGKKVRKIIRYLGSDLTKKQIEKLRKRAEELILEEVKDKNLLEYELNEDELELYRGFDKKIDVSHLQKINWKKFTATFSYNTNAIEGSTVSLPLVKELVNHDEKPENSEEVESINVANAINFIKNVKEELSLSLIKKIHKICFEGTKTFAGKIRKVEVAVKDGQGNIIHRGAPATDVTKLLNELCDWYKIHKRKYPPLFLCAFVHDQFETIHPFQDGNGRVGRLLLNYVLLKHKYPPINIRLKDRSDYYHVLWGFQKKGDIKPTMRFLIREYKKQYR